MIGRTGGSVGIIVRASRIMMFLVLSMFRLGDIPKPTEIRNTRGKGWRFFNEVF